MPRFFKKLTKKKLRINGRNHSGKITIFHRGGGVKKRYRIIDFFYSFLNISGIVLKIEKDPNRNSFIALILFKNGFFSYILAPNNLLVGSFIQNVIHMTNLKSITLGTSLILKILQVGSVIHNIELYEGHGGALCRAAGSFGIIMSQTNFSNDFVIVKLKSSEEYLLNSKCFASIGIVSNCNFKAMSLKKAGTSRLLGRRPTVRGVAMNPIDHPHGGGEGKTSGGRPSVTPWGKLTKGKKTRSKSKNSKFIYKLKNQII